MDSILARDGSLPIYFNTASKRLGYPHSYVFMRINYLLYYYHWSIKRKLLLKFKSLMQTNYPNHNKVTYVGRAIRKPSSSLSWQRRPRSDCASAQSDQSLRCPLPESMNTIECINCQQRPGWDLARAQDDVNPHILRMPEGTFPLVAAHYKMCVS